MTDEQSAILATGPHVGDPPLPHRRGVRPRTTATNPHSQLDQQPPRSVIDVLLARLAGMMDIEVGPSFRAPRGTVGFYLRDAVAAGPQEAFMLGREFAHVHPGADGSLHLTLPPGLREEAIAKGWAEAHPLAGYPTISSQIVMAYAPRDAGEIDVVAGLVEASRRYARGTWPT